MNLWVLKRRVHVSWLIAVLAAGAVAGVMSAQYVPAGWFGDVVWLVVAVTLTAVGFWRGKIYALPVVLLAGLVLGLWRGSVAQAELTPYKNLIGHAVTVAGSIGEDPDSGKSGEVLLRLERISIDGHELAGKIWISTHGAKELKRGDVVAVKGKLMAGFGSFAASMYRATVVKMQRPVPGDVAGQVRDWFADAVRQAIPEPESSLGIGYLVGQRRALPPSLDEALKIAGLTHVVVASGYNLTILVRLARRLFVKVSKYLATLSASAMILAFIAITGASPSMSRAGLVAGLSLAAWYYGRKFHPLVLLPFAAAVTLLVNPAFGWNDLGWQLSFAAFAGVMLVAPLGQAYFFGSKKPGTVRQILGETIAATLATLPILVVAFGQFSNVALVSNLLILPLVPLAMLLTFIAGIGALIFPAAASFVGVPASLLLHYMTSTAQYLAVLPWAQTTFAATGWMAAVYYIVLVGGCAYVWRKTKFNLRSSNIVE